MAEHTKSVKLGEIIREFDLEILHKGPDYEDTPLTTLDVNRPGLPLSGFFEHFDTRRLLVIGLTEHTFLNQMTPEERRTSFDKLLSYPVPALILTRALEPYPECMEMAIKHDRTVLRTAEHTSAFMSRLIGSLFNHLAPQITRHGVLMNIYGQGVLMIGDSGIGKSETAIELLKRGHRLVADDAVEIRRISDSLYGSAPEIIRHYIEIRGIGIIDVQQLFGMGAVQFDSDIEIVIHLEPWQDGKFYDRLGLEGDTYTILGVQLPYVTIPVRPGRNLAGIVEIAAMKNRQMRYGYNSARDFMTQFDQKMDELARQAKEKQ